MTIAMDNQAKTVQPRAEPRQRHASGVFSVDIELRRNFELPEGEFRVWFEEYSRRKASDMPPIPTFDDE